MFPSYADIETPLKEELRRRGGYARPKDQDVQGRTIYDALADHFDLSPAERSETILENGVERSKWENMVRWARRKLVERGELDNSQHGVWRLV